MADYKFDDWKKTLEELQSSVQKGLAEMRQQKMAVQQLKTEVLEKLESGKFLRDDERIVISAPEIVIGNVENKPDLEGPGWTVKDGDAAIVTVKDEDLTAENSYTVITKLVINKKGSILPATGGIGTVLFYVIGSALIAGAGLLFVTKKR